MAADRRRRRRAPRTEKTSILLVTNGALTEKIYLEEIKRRALRTETAAEENLAVKVITLNGETDTLVRKLSSPHGIPRITTRCGSWSTRTGRSATPSSVAAGGRRRRRSA